MQWLQRAPLLLAIMLWPAQAPGELSWLSTDWIVTCEPDVPDWPNDPLCDDESAVGVAAITRSGLEQASVWFKDLGFHGPDVETVSRSYRARVSDTVTDGALGLYFSGLKELYVNSTYYFAIARGETEAERRTTAGLQIAGMGAMVHELFHAIQHGYQPGEAFDSIEHDWIWEGTAHAVERVWLEQNDLHQEALFRPRRWDVPLDRPVDALDAYATSRFWHWVGREIQSPGDIAYLQDVFENDLDRRRGLDGVDLALRRFRTGGLYALYPEFVARALKSKWRRVQRPFRPDHTAYGRRAGCCCLPGQQCSG